ncbi:MAG TPA: N-acetyl-alpha-D-glucosaminyl L-malate synthase BshA [Gemmatimonadales bacterium]|nr:N-acetyl-alpha-D-glucosaminyl L-malate synthase BshA [Gemmatimonadales bacterium]
MRIGITCYPTYGGSGAVATELGIALAHRGHEVHLISYASPFRLRHFAEHVFFHEVDISSGAYPLLEYFPYDLALAVKQHEVAHRERLDVLHVHYAVPHATAAFLAKQMLAGERDLKVITTLHGTDITLVGQARSFFTITKFSIERSDAVTAVSEYLREETYRAFECRPCGIEVIPNFVNLKEYFPRDHAPRPAFAPAGKKLVMHVSNFRLVKQVPEVVRIFARIRATVPSVLVLVGDGPGRAEAEAETERLGLQDDVFFLGKLDTVADLLQAADLFLMPSKSESFGLAALEAMACGVPVVASRIGGLPEVVVEGQTGWMVPAGPGATEAMADLGIAVLTDQALWQRTRAAAVARAREFSADNVVPRYEALYRRLAEG